ncbi:aldo/keto reductase [Algoriphagus sediminis]|uniref:Aldo/keto reductase n=1 Tax=Algoriphagus sediminis TaxID=3057113 RepID=A0ABT7YDJ4_9BACT|nr:aldo/keto reductase [Algoriphagus sediminis]MDN3204553.1 aldo/keto reductase [Algoriphagus sediminis]
MTKPKSIITGLWQIADLERDGKTVDARYAANAMKKYVDAGFDIFDMADHYGSAELIAGEFRKLFGPDAAKHYTKWVPKPGKLSKEIVKEAVTKALKRLQTDQIELMQFHAWNYADPAWIDALFWLQELKNEGLITDLGLTNFDTAHLSVIVKSGIEIKSNQVCFSLLDQRASKQMGDFCEKHGIELLAFGTLAGGFFSEKWLGANEPKIDKSLTWSQMKYKRFMDTATSWQNYQSLLRLLDKIAKNHQVSIANVASNFILHQKGVSSVIIGARLGKSEHIEDNKKILNLKLSEGELTEIQEMISGFNPIPGDCGDEYRKPPFLTASGDLSDHLEDFPSPYPVYHGKNGSFKALSGTVWEDIAGFSRAIRKGNRISISGTTATHGEKAMGGDDPAAQTHFVIDKIEGALQSLGASLENVTRTRIFIKNLEQWEAVARVHGERFAGIQPANTMVRADLIGKEYLVEIEAEAEL